MLTPLATVLIVDDAQHLRRSLAELFAADGYHVLEAADGDEALTVLAGNRPDVIFLDLNMPHRDGLSTLTALKSDPDRQAIPVVILTSFGGSEQTITAMKAGAYDYITKPFSFDELLERIRIQLRTAGREAVDVVRAGAMSYDPRTREVDFGNGPVVLSDRESRVFESLLRDRGEVVSRERLLSTVWGYSFRPDTNVVDVCIKRLRAKVGCDRIETVRGLGYRFVG